MIEIGLEEHLHLGHDLNLRSPTLVQFLSGLNHSLSAVVIVSLERTTITQIASSDNHMLAIDRHGVLYSWGSNRFGQLGRETSDKTNSLSPLRVDKFRSSVICGIAAGELSNALERVTHTFVRRDSFCLLHDCGRGLDMGIEQSWTTWSPTLPYGE
jgi:alpha-tubulin suppressor-like RCC1 family protein